MGIEPVEIGPGVIVLGIGEEGVVDEGDFCEEGGAFGGDMCQKGQAVVPDWKY